MNKVDRALAATVLWEDDPDTFDLRLFALGQGQEEFVIVNPKFDPWILDYLDTDSEDSDKCVVWHINNSWIAKKFKSSWSPSSGWQLIECEIELDTELILNDELEPLEFNINCHIPFDDSVYEYVYYLDPSLDPAGHRPWVAKVKYAGVPTVGSKDQGYVLPKEEFLPQAVYNNDLPELNWDSELPVPFYDLRYENVWYLDPQFNPFDNKISVVKKVVKSDKFYGTKDRGYIKPKIIFNPDVPKLDYDVSDKIPYYELNYEHVWMLDPSLHTDHDEIWAAKIVPKINQGTKVVGHIGVKMADFDVVFISYHEPNAEANWHRVLEKFPRAKRVKNVRGIFEAHKQAAQMATTPMFYVIDGDAELVDTWEFNFKVNVFDMDCVHLWTSINPINDLEYGYGGVKLFPRQLLLDATTWNIDLTTGLGKLKLINKISNVTAFNYDPFTTWRSAFRECVKLSSSLDPDALRRLEIWCTMGADRENGQYAIDGAKLGRQYGMDYLNDPDKLKLINNYDWMKHEFNEFYRQQ